MRATITPHNENCRIAGLTPGHFSIACIYGALGDKDRAFDELNKAFAARDWELYRLNVDPYWKPLRDDPRFTELVKRLNLLK